MKNLKLLTLVLTLVAIVGFPAVSKAQQVPTQDMRKMVAKQLSGKVTQMNPTDNTITLMVQDKALTFSADKLKGSPRVGSVVYLVEQQQARYFFTTCEKCNAVCPGVCFLESDYCRCYLLHL